MRHICFYLSDHGFGHISRNIPIMLRLLECDDVALTVVCGEKHNAFARENFPIVQRSRITFRSIHTDIGLILKNGTLLVDDDKLETETLLYLDSCAHLSKKEAEWLNNNHVDVAVCDMPLWSIEACRQANVPLLYIGNFTWTELYREHLSESVWKRYADEYRKLDHVMLYALHNSEMLEFLGGASDITETSVLCRSFSKEASEIKSRHERPLVFVALGMSASFETNVNVEGLPFDFIVNDGVPFEGSNVTRLDWTVQNTQDYILASDYIISNAGWATVAEAILASKPMALFSRDTVLEDRTTIQILEEQDLAIKIHERELTDIPSIIKKLDLISVDRFSAYYDASEDIARKILSLI